MAALIASATISPVPGWAEWPLTTTGQPAASAAAGVAARGRKGQREIGGAENGDRPDRALYHLDVGARQRLAVGQGRVVAAVEIVAFFNMRGEQAQLTGRASALGNQPRFGQAGLGAADFGDGVGARIDFFGDGDEKTGAFDAGRIAIGPEGGLGRLGGNGRQGPACPWKSGGAGRRPVRSRRWPHPRSTRPRSGVVHGVDSSSLFPPARAALRTARCARHVMTSGRPYHDRTPFCR